MIRFDNGGDHEWFMRILVPVIVFTCLCGIATAAETIAVGKSSFEFVDHQGDPTRPVTVWTFIPEGCLPGCPVQYVFHGVERNGEEYLGNWIGFAKAGRFIVVVPEFSRKHYPKDADYSLGRALDEPDPEKRPFAVPDHLFEHLKSRLQFDAATYRAFGHSAGGQFVQRWLLFRPESRASVIIAANPGWYTLPEWNPERVRFPFPFSLVGSPIGQQQLQQALSRRFTLMLGERDIDPRDKNLNRSPGASAQGVHRFERGQNFFVAAREAAGRLGLPFVWDLVVVPGARHDNFAMARAAVEYMNRNVPK